MNSLKFSIRSTAIAAAVVSMSLHVSQPALAADETVSADQFRTIAKDAYLYAFPMIVAYKVLLDYNINRDSGAFRAPFNILAREARVYTSDDTAVSTPNSDTPYAFVQLDLRAEPIVLCMPEVDPKRYYDVQLTDMYTFNYGYMGSRTTGNGPGCYMVAGPDWVGEKPESINKVFRSDTQFTLAIFRTQLFEPSDMGNVKDVQTGYDVKPLSIFLGARSPNPAPAITWLEFKKSAFTTDFPKYLNFLLQFAPAKGGAEDDIPLREKFSKIGIEAGADFDFSKLAPEYQAALGEAIKAANADIAKTAASVGTTINGWQIGAAAGSRQFFAGDLVLRATGSKLGIYGNDAEEATYPFTRNDVSGNPLDGSTNNYTLTFTPDEFPPVRAFWSVTMYDGKTQLLVDNPIDRYLINSPMLSKLKKNPDGSLTFYIQKDSPGQDKEANWLPAPEGPIFLVMRLYWPETNPPSVFPLGSGSWAPPGIVPNPQ